jgi:hypothetical protein
MSRNDETAGVTGHTTGADPALLGIYLNDHLAGATLGSELAARLAAAHRASDEAATFERLAAEIAEDRTALLESMATLSVPARRYKVAVGWLAQQATRLKPNGRLLERSPLRSLEEIEMMRLGVQGKDACWRTLRTLADRDDRLDKARLDELLARANRQADTLEELRLRVMDELMGAA